LDPHVTDHDIATAVYDQPRIEDYGTLRDITAQLEQALPAGIGIAGVSSAPTGGPPPGGPERQPPGPTPEGNPGSGLGGEEESSGGGGGAGGGGGSGVGGAELGGGGGGGGGGETVSGNAAELPFTGFPAAMAAAVGAGMASAGAALRRALKRR
jgi:hypothetical protein